MTARDPVFAAREAPLGSLQRGDGPLASYGCECPWEQIASDEWRTYHAEDCPFLHRPRTSCPKTRDLAGRVLKALTIMRDPEGDEDDWLLPDLKVIASGMSALGNLVQRAEDRHRFKIALERIGKEWTDGSASSDEIRHYARTIVAGGSSRVPLRAANSHERPGDAE